MISQAAFFGGSRDVTLGATATLFFSVHRVQVIRASSAGLSFKCQSARQLRTGGPIGLVVNAGSNAFNLTDQSGGALLTLNPGDCVELALVDNLTAAGTWILLPGTANSLPDPGPNLRFYLCGGLPSGTYDQTQREYNSQADVWTQKSDMPSPTTRIDEGAVGVVGTAGYWVGITGSTGTDRTRIFRYDPDTWTQMNQGPSQMSQCAALGLGSSVLVFNGSAFDAYHTDEYVTGGDSWTSRTARPVGRRITNPTIGLANSKAVLTDGTSNAVDTYSVDTWTAKTGRPGADARRCTTTAKSNVCYVYGGAASGLFIANVYNYTEAVDTWAAMTSMSSGREMAGACNIGSFNYLAGGKKGAAGASSAGTGPVTKETVEHTIAADTYLVKADVSPVGASPNGAYNVLNQGAAVTP